MCDLSMLLWNTNNKARNQYSTDTTTQNNSHPLSMH